MTTLSAFVLLATLVAPAQAAPESAAAPTAPPATKVVTLVTGDEVHVTGDKVAVETGPGRENIDFLQELDGADIRIVPSDAAPLIARGRLDKRLFNVSQLVRDGFTNGPLPLIVTGAKPVGVQAVRTMASIDAIAVRASAPVWESALHDDTKIWLDGKAKQVLDRSTAQVGATTAWAKGITGKGVTVADLDSGWDPQHPDLVPNVVEAVDFTGTAVKDGHGHGTHTLSTIAGTGAASQGRYKGVAPDAKVLVGKVCTDDGSCPESAIIAGMEWAAAKGAAAVNLSLGGSPTDGTDPMSQAVNRLTTQHGTLFVIAAGNYGADRTVGAPGAADAALTVASVTKADELSTFSSRGPRVGDFAVKPDIAAPGTAIVAARAKGTAMGAPVDDFYTSASGTSMATPHVTGAAALLKQAHPQWTAAELKAALMNGAAGLNLPIYAQGAGRLDVARALDQSVRSTPASLSFPYLAWPHKDDVTQTVSYHNDGTAPVTLALQLDGAAFSLSAKEITVPAGASASVDVTVHAAGASGTLGGVLVASGGGTVVRTPVGVTLEEEKYTLSIKATARDGSSPWFSTVQAINVETGVSAAYFFADDTAPSVRIPKGRYDVHAIVYDNKGPRTLMSQPDTDFGGDTAVTFDARQAVPMSPRTSRPTEQRMFLLSLRSGNKDRDTGVSLLSAVKGETFAAPTRKPVTGRKFQFFYQPMMVEPKTQDTYNLLYVRDGVIPDPADFIVREKDLAHVRATYQTQGGAPTVGVRGGFVYLKGVSPNATVLVDMPLPLTRNEYYTPGPDVEWDSQLGLRAPGASQVEYQLSPRRAYAKKDYRITWNRGPIGPAVGSYADGWGLMREGDTITASVPLFSTEGNWSYTQSWNSTAKAVTTLSRDGKEIGRSPWPGWIAQAVPQDAGVYTLATSAQRAAPWSLFATEVSAEWTFRAPGTVEKRTALPLFVVRASADLNEVGVAPAGRPFVLDLSVERVPGAKYGRVRPIGLEVSYDDGATWKRVPVLGHHALLVHPRGKAFVSLRSTVSDSLGNSVKQTVLRAYQVAPR